MKSFGFSSGYVKWLLTCDSGNWLRIFRTEPLRPRMKPFGTWKTTSSWSRFGRRSQICRIERRTAAVQRQAHRRAALPRVRKAAHPWRQVDLGPLVGEKRIDECLMVGLRRRGGAMGPRKPRGIEHLGAKAADHRGDDLCIQRFVAG